MKNLSAYFEVPFDDKNVNHNTLLAFATDHYARLVANNPGGRYDERIAALAAGLAAFRQSLGETLIRLGKRKSSKSDKRRVRRTLSQGISRIAASVIATFGPQSAEYKTCFPIGRRVFTVCPDDLLKSHLSSLHQALVKLEDELGPEVIARSTALRSEWQAAYTNSETATAQKAAAEETRRAARATLQLELFFNLLEIIKHHPRQPEALNLYMQPHLLRSRRKRKAEALPAE